MEQTGTLPPTSSAHHPTLIDHELSTIREMLATLNTLSIAGQRHLMGKVIAFIDGHVERIMREARDSAARRLAEHLAMLKDESERPLPSVARFGRHTETTLELLVAGTTRRPAPRAAALAEIAVSLGGAAQIGRSRTELTASP